MSKHRRIQLSSAGLLCSLALALPAVAPASVIFTNFGSGMSYNTTGGNAVGNAFDGNNYGEGETFTPSATATLGSIEVELSCAVSCPASDNFTIALRSDSGGSPGGVIEGFVFTNTTLNSLGLNNTPITAASVAMPTLTAGTAYWVTVMSSINDAIAWNWNSTGDSANQAISPDGGANWFAPSGLTPGAFQVNSAAGTATPEPTTLMLIGGSLSLLCLVGKRSTRLCRSMSRPHARG
jgi:hypothetical protein